MTTDEHADTVAASPTGRRSAMVTAAACFVATLLVPLGGQLARAFRAGNDRPAAPADASARGRTPAAWLSASARAAARRVAGFASGFEDAGAVAGLVRSPIQGLLTRLFGYGNERVVVGRGGWLFYRPEVEALTRPGFLAAGPARARESDPRPAIADFARQLRARGITLVLMPAPGKASVEPERLSPRLETAAGPVEDASLAGFAAEMERDGVALLDPAAALWRAKAASRSPLYLATDTHWRPQGAALAAAELARLVRERVRLPQAADPGYRLEASSVTGAGDLAGMLALPRWAAFAGERVGLEQVLDRADRFCRPRPDADVLLLGDSFANVFSYAAMGWGEAAGLAERLAYELRRPVDVIERNDDGAFATRAILAHELAMGRDRLAGKRVVIWEFAARELSVGDWRILPLELRRPVPARFLVPPRGTSVVASGTIAAMAPIPRPRSAPYADYVVGLHLVDVGTSGRDGNGEALVFMWAMRARELTPAARLRVGDRVTLRLRPWADVEAEVSYASRGELLEGDLMLQEPCWGEEVRD